jgi:hypothetical protein
VPLAKGEPLIPKGSRRSRIGLISWSELLNPRVSRPPKTIEPHTAVEARVEAEGPTEELEAGGNLPPPSRTFEDFKKFCAAQKAKGRGSQGSSSRGTYGEYKKRGKGRGKGQ